jgi:hypothetical protein
MLCFSAAGLTLAHAGSSDANSKEQFSATIASKTQHAGQGIEARQFARQQCQVAGRGRRLDSSALRQSIE